MGYESTCHLVDVRIKPSSLDEFKRIARRAKRVDDASLQFFLERAVVDSERFLEFTASEDGLDPYQPCEGENTVPALYGKWRHVELIASWLKQYAEEGGRIVLHSIEADGEAWGWEFDGQGRMRALALQSIGEWQ